jgi:hypothetical protein
VAFSAKGKNDSKMQTNPFSRFSIKWTLTTTLGWLIAQTTGLLITKAVFPKAEIETITTSPLYWIVFGILFGLSQWVNLRNHIPHSLRWVLATTIGFFMAAWILRTLNRIEIIHYFFSEFSIFPHLLGGTLFSFAQYQTLKKVLQKSYWWIIINGISWTITAGFFEIDIISMQVVGLLFFTTTTGISFGWLVQNSSVQTQAT